MNDIFPINYLIDMSIITTEIIEITNRADVIRLAGTFAPDAEPCDCDEGVDCSGILTNRCDVCGDRDTCGRRHNTCAIYDDEPDLAGNHVRCDGCQRWFSVEEEKVVVPCTKKCAAWRSRVGDFSIKHIRHAETCECHCHEDE